MISLVGYFPDDLRTGGVSLLEVHNSSVVEAGVLCIMVCLKIMVANSRPWWVNSTYCRLVRPLSSRL